LTSIRPDAEAIPPLVGIAQRPQADTVGAAWLAILALSLGAGIVFRLMLPNDIEFHGDEKFTFDHVMNVLQGGSWPAHGMTMSIGGPNPGMSVWIFIILGWVFRPETPPDLARAVQLLNVTALMAFLAFIVTAISRRQREVWLWGLALWAVNPLAVIYERKIWPPSVLPLFIVMMLFGWWYSRRWQGSFLFGLIATISGQIHPTAAFFAIAIAAWKIFDDRRSFHVAGLISGVGLGLIPALSWIPTYFKVGNGLHQLRLPFLTFYGRWLTEPFGFGADHVLGPLEFTRFLGWPEIGGAPTYLSLLLHVAIGVIAVIVLAAGALALYRSGKLTVPWLLAGETIAGRVVRAVFFGFGTVLTLLTVRGGGLYPHYLIVVAPMMMLWVALTAAFADGGALATRGRALLSGLCVCNGVIVLLLFSYIDTRGDIHGEFGPSWWWQQAQPVPPAIEPTR
jgi:hypothetical protein